MSHFARVEPLNLEEQLFVVVEVIVAEKDFIDSGIAGNPNFWVQTSYNTFGGIHYNQLKQENGSTIPVPSGKSGLRKNFAGVGFIYDKKRDAFYRQRPSQNHVLNESTCLWEIDSNSI